MVFSAPKSVVRVLIRFVGEAKVISMFCWTPVQKSLMAFVYLEQFDYFITLL